MPSNHSHNRSYCLSDRLRMKTRIKRLVSLTSISACFSVTAGQPLHDVLMLRTIEVLRCEAVTENNVAQVSSIVRASSPSSAVRVDASEVAASVPGFLVEGIVRRQRDLAFSIMGGADPVKHTSWADARNSVPLKFFVRKSDPDVCEVFAPGRRLSVVVSQKAECDTYPPTGICVFDHPIRIVDPGIWAKYGE